MLLPVVDPLPAVRPQRGPQIFYGFAAIECASGEAGEQTTDGQEYPVNAIVLRMQLAQPAVSKHLSALRKAGVVTVAKRGQHRMYRLNARSLKTVHDWAKGFERYWTHQVDKSCSAQSTRRWRE